MRARWDTRVWRRPLFWPLAEALSLFDGDSDWPAIASFDARLASVTGMRFSLAEPRRRGSRRLGQRRSYDASICCDGVVPTRARNWHDFFNALVWAAFPRSKRALHARQLRAASTAGRRTRQGDALAMLDEGGVVLLCARNAWAAMRSALERWPREAGAIESVREAAERGELVGAIYGHAVFEHLAERAPPVRALALLAACDRVPASRAACRELADAMLAATLADAGAFADPDACHSLPATPDVLGAPRDVLAHPEPPPIEATRASTPTAVRCACSRARTSPPTAPMRCSDSATLLHEENRTEGPSATGGLPNAGVRP